MLLCEVLFSGDKLLFVLGLVNLFIFRCLVFVWLNFLNLYRFSSLFIVDLV